MPTLAKLSGNKKAASKSRSFASEPSFRFIKIPLMGCPSQTRLAHGLVDPRCGTVCVVLGLPPRQDGRLQIRVVGDNLFLTVKGRGVAVAVGAGCSVGVAARVAVVAGDVGTAVASGVAVAPGTVLTKLELVPRRAQPPAA